jgi:[ribosomal protein S5]-alanine N-acetyltransferase
MTPRLIPLNRQGEPTESNLPMPPELAENNRQLAAFLETVGFEPPWIGYVLWTPERGAVGGGAFKGPPQRGRVEIAYFTLSAEQSRGFAGHTARLLVALARQADPTLIVSAETLPEPNASTRILERLGFVRTGVALDPDAGQVWHWELAPLALQSAPDNQPPAGLPVTPLGRYRHYKGAEYEVLGCVRHSETEEFLVLYRALYGAEGLWVRPHALFFGQVFSDGRWQPRFAPLREPD